MSSEPTGFLYPFIEGDERDVGRLLDELATSAVTKAAVSRAVTDAALDTCRPVLSAAGAAMAARFAEGGRLFAFGNGGSATDADSTVELFRDPPAGVPLPAVSLVADRAVLTALANDVGYDVVFARQLAAHARPGDIALGLSTSGGSRNVLDAMDHAARAGLLTVGLAGYSGGAMAASESVAHCLLVRSESVHRIQEAQDALVVALWTVVQEHLGAAAAPEEVLG